jgi:hypothetical protein
MRPTIGAAIVACGALQIRVKTRIFRNNGVPKPGFGQDSRGLLLEVFMTCGRALGVAEPCGLPQQIGDLTRAQSDLLRRAMLRDVAIVGSSIQHCTVDVLCPATGTDSRQVVLPPGVRLMAQQRVAPREAFRHLRAGGSSALLLVRADVPTLHARQIEDAFVALESDECDVVIGPTGGRG